MYGTNSSDAAAEVLWSIIGTHTWVLLAVRCASRMSAHVQHTIRDTLYRTRCTRNINLRPSLHKSKVYGTPDTSAFDAARAVAQALQPPS